MQLPKRDPPPPIQNFGVLVVEDEFLIAMELTSALQDAGFQVLKTAPSVAVALDFLRVSRPDAAVLDVSLRGERVTPVAMALAAMNVPFVLTSAYGEDDLADEPVLAAAENLGKPTPHGRLLEILRRFRGHVED